MIKAQKEKDEAAELKLKKEREETLRFAIDISEL